MSACDGWGRKAGVVAGIAGLLSVVLLLAAPGPRAQAGVGPFGVTSANVEHIRLVPFPGGNLVGGRLLGDYFYVTSLEAIAIYDVSDRVDPRLVSMTPVGFQFENEDVATDGGLLLFSEQLPLKRLHVWDVSDKRQPREIAVLPGAGSHTATCILGCRYDYGGYTFADPVTGTDAKAGILVDLRNPAQPTLLGTWSDHVRPPMTSSQVHDVFEVRPGLVLTASAPILFLDARTDPLHPTVLAKGIGPGSGQRQHSVLWPDHGKDRFVLASFERNFNPDCAAKGYFSVWDTLKWQATGTFERVDTHILANGNFLDGSPPANALGCSHHWFDAHPKFDDGGLVAIGSYEHGTRFLRVADDGQVSEAGYFQSWAGATGAAYWVSNCLVYSLDTDRGIDILRWAGPVANGRGAPACRERLRTPSTRSRHRTGLAARAPAR